MSTATMIDQFERDERGTDRLTETLEPKLMIRVCKSVC